MKIENPYKENIAEGGWEMPSGEQNEHNAWEEGYHSRDEVVGRLAEACSAVIIDQDEYGLITNHTLDLLEAVIAKAKP